MIGTTAAILLAASAGAQVGGQIYASKKAASTARHAADIEGKAAGDALAFEREQDAQRRREWEAQETAKKAAWNSEQARLADEDARREPIRRAKYAMYQKLAAQSGVRVPDYVAAAPRTPDVAQFGPAPTAPTTPTNNTMPVAPRQPLSNVVRGNPIPAAQPIHQLERERPSLLQPQQPQPQSLGDSAIAYRRPPRQSYRSL
jgi:hypothetical protein